MMAERLTQAAVSNVVLEWVISSDICHLVTLTLLEFLEGIQILHLPIF